MNVVPIMILTLGLLVTGCQRVGDNASAAADSSAVKSSTVTEGREFMLGITGYNYTDRDFSWFSVDGAGGGNLPVSTPTSSGNGVSCCIVWRVGTPLPVKMNVRWAAHKCLKRIEDRGEVFDALIRTHHDRDVEFNGPIPADPAYLEVHFYPDGRIGVEVTSRLSESRLKLDPGKRQRPGPCKEEAKP